MRLVAQFPTIANVQDAQGWSVINHAMSKGNAAVAGIVLSSVKEGGNSLGLISAVPYLVHTSVKFHQEEDSKADGLADKSSRMMSFFGGKSFANKSFASKSFAANKSGKSGFGLGAEPSGRKGSDPTRECNPCSSLPQHPGGSPGVPVRLQRQEGLRSNM